MTLARTERRILLGRFSEASPVSFLRMTIPLLLGQIESTNRRRWLSVVIKLRHEQRL
jgi:hypothetical protein